MDRTNLYSIIVMYNRFVESCDNLENVLSLNGENFHIVIVDNSTENSYIKKNKQFCEDNKIEYLPMNGNKGLSKAYNRAIDFIDSKNEMNDWIMTLDQDTYISTQYIESAIASINSTSSYPVKTGEIFFDNRIGSPTKIYKNKPIEICNNLYTNVQCINSCLIIRLQELLLIGKYNEELFLDMVDYLILYNLRKIGLTQLEILDGKIIQEFSGDKFSSKAADISRFKIYSKDLLAYKKITHSNSFYIYYVLMKRALNLSVHYKKNFFQFINY